MSGIENRRPHSESARRAFASLLFVSLASRSTPGSAGPPGGQSQAPSAVPFVDASTLVRDMTRQQVVVSADGRTEQKVVVPARYCAALAPGASKAVNLQDIRWGLRTTTPVPITRRTTVTLRWPGQPPRQEVLADGLPGSSERAFTFPRPGPRTVQVTLFVVGGVRPSTGRTTGSITDGTSNTIIVSESARTPPAQTVCLSDVFVLDPQVEVRVNVAGSQGQADTDSRTSF